MNNWVYSLDLDYLVSEINEALMPFDEILFVYLYGSMVKGVKGVGRDVDVALYLDRDFAEPALYPAHISGIIENRITENIMVDVRVLNHQSLRFQFRVIKEGIVVLSRDDEKRVNYESKITLDYLDVKPYLDYYDSMRVRRLAGEG